MKFRFVKFRFDPERHEYWLDGECLPSVSEIINPLNDFSNIPKGVLEHKGNLGTAFHDTIALYLKDDIDESTIDERLIKPFDAFKAWSMPQLDHLKTGIIEMPTYSKELSFAGTPDLVLPDIIYDWKLRKYNSIKDPLQLSGYSRLVGGKKRNLTTICFDLEGNFRIHNSYNTQAWPMFVAMLTRWKDEQSFNKLCEQWKESVK